MAHENQDEGLIRRYLLGLLADDELRQLEERMMVDNEFYDQVLLAEDEMVEEYVRGDLPESDRADFQASFLSTPEGRQQATYAEAMRKYVKPPSPTSETEGQVDEGPVAKDLVAETPSAKGRPTEVPTAEESLQGGNVIRPVWWRRPQLVSYLRSAAAAVIVLGVAFGIWRVFFSQSRAFFSQSEVSTGIAALALAYRDQRPFEARISGLNYAPVANTRGGEENVDSTARNLAESVLLDAVLKHPNAATHNAAGKLYLAEKKFEEAIKQFEEAVKTDPNNAQLHSDYGAALLEEGKADCERNERGKGLEEFASALEHVNRALELDGSLLEALFNRALLHQEMALRPQAEEDWNKYLEKDFDSAWAEEARQNLKNLEQQDRKKVQNKEDLLEDFTVAYHASDWEQAWAAWSRSRFRNGNYVAEKLLDEWLFADSRGDRAEEQTNLQMVLYASELQAQKTHDQFDRDLARFYESADSKQRKVAAKAREAVRLAKELYDQSKLDEAIVQYKVARQEFKDAGDVCESLRVEYWIGHCLVQKPDTKHCVEILNRLIPICESKSYSWLLAISLSGLANALTRLNEHTKAIDCSKRALKLSFEIGDQNGALRVLSQLASENRDLGDYRESLRFAQETFLLGARMLPDPSQFVGICATAGWVFNAMGLYSAALDYHKEALRLGLEMQNPLVISRYYVELGLVYGRLKNYGEAVRNISLGLEAGEPLASESIGQEMTAFATLHLAGLYNAIGNTEAAIDAYNDAIERYRKIDDHAFMYQAYKGRVLAYISRGEYSAIDQEIERVIKIFEQYRSRILDESHRNSFFESEQSIYDLAIDFEHSKMFNEQKAFEYSERSRARSLLDLTTATQQLREGDRVPDIRFSSSSAALTLMEVQERMPDQAQILQYAAVENKVIMWVVSRTGISSRESDITLQELNAKVDNYLKTVSSRPKPGDEEAWEQAVDLYNILVRPVEPLLDKSKQTFIVPDKKLNYLPFVTLAPEIGKRLLEDYTIISSPSSSIFVHCYETAREKQGTGDEVLLSVGNPSFDHNARPSFINLPSATEEAETIAKYYKMPCVLVEENAREDTVTREMRRADVIHLALHYVADENSPLLSKLLLAKENVQAAGDREPDGILQAYEIYRLGPMRARLIVLSGCRTSIEQLYKGEGAIGIARPFIAASVPLVIASLWAVDSSATADLMINFHKYRKDGHLTTAESLRQAQIAMLNGSEQNHRHPYYWASFSVLGGYAKF